MKPEQENQRSGTTASQPSTKQDGGSRAAGQPEAARTSGAGGLAGEAASRAGEAARQVGSQAQDAASSLGSEASDRARRFADRQLSMGADVVSDMAEAVRAAAERLDRNEPQIAHLARGAADRIEDLSDTIRGQSAEELWQASAAFARRRPAVVFGATAGLGFLLYRLLKPGSSRNFGAADAQRDFERNQAGAGRPGGGQAMAGENSGVRERQSRGGQVHGA